jgi:hypothetical protein
MDQLRKAPEGTTADDFHGDHGARARRRRRRDDA